MSSEQLTQAERAVLEKLADALIPAAPGCLSATDAGVGDNLLAQATTYAPSLPALLRRVVVKVGERTPQTALLSLKKDDPAAYDVFCEMIAAIYFLSPQVRAGVGFPGREPKPAKVDVSDLEDLLLPVMEGGFSPRGI